MPNYRRARSAGATYFFTATLADRESKLLVEKVDVLRFAIRQTMIESPFIIDAIVILPDHLHCVWTLPPDDADFPVRWQRIKARFSYGISVNEDYSKSRRSRRERGIWQRRFWEHLIRNDADYATHVHYIHYNPVKHNHVERVADWPYSSFHRFLRAGTYPIDWGGTRELESDFGERRCLEGRRGGAEL
jgi:putative transposase